MESGEMYERKGWKQDAQRQQGWREGKVKVLRWREDTKRATDPL